MPHAPNEKRDHTIDRRHADDLIELYRRSAQGKTLLNREGEHGGVFHADAVRELLDQEGVAFLRYEHAARPNGDRTLILSALRADGTTIPDLTLDYHFPCPPFCP